MKTKSNKNTNKFDTNHKKRRTMHTLHWYLDVGFHYGTLTKSQAINVARVDNSTFNRWYNGKAAAPDATLELLRLHAFGEPPSASSVAWRGFRFQNDALITEDGRMLTPGDLKAVFYWKKMASSYITLLAARERTKIYANLRRIYRQA